MCRLIYLCEISAFIRKKLYLNGREYFRFFKISSTNKNNADIKLYQQRLTYVSNPKFLGITFDENLKFEKHVEQIKESSISRLNILKILTYSNWSLRQRTI
jgi:hypothetical protein